MHVGFTLSHSAMFVLVAGPHGIRWPCLLNLPYVIVPFFFGAKWLLQGRSENDKEVRNICHFSFNQRHLKCFNPANHYSGHA
jgi:hypothetical protein